MRKIIVGRLDTGSARRVVIKSSWESEFWKHRWSVNWVQHKNTNTRAQDQRRDDMLKAQSESVWKVEVDVEVGVIRCISSHVMTSRGLYKLLLA